MNSYDQSGCAFSQVPLEYEVQTVMSIAILVAFAYSDFGAPVYVLVA